MANDWTGYCIECPTGTIPGLNLEDCKPENIIGPSSKYDCVGDREIVSASENCVKCFPFSRA